MWAQYAANHSGVCICFDKEKLRKEVLLLCDKNKAIKPYFGKIQYVPFLQYNSTVKTKSEHWTEEHIAMFDTVRKDFIHKHGDQWIAKKLEEDKNYKFYFFRKLLNWRDENEYRIVCQGSGEKTEVQIKDCIKYVILGYKCDNKRAEIIELCKDNNIPLHKITYLHGNATFDL
jgi:hypothetical protein